MWLIWWGIRSPQFIYVLLQFLYLSQCLPKGDAEEKHVTLTYEISSKQTRQCESAFPKWRRNAKIHRESELLKKLFLLLTNSTWYSSITFKKRHLLGVSLQLTLLDSPFMTNGRTKTFMLQVNNKYSSESEAVTLHTAREQMWHVQCHTMDSLISKSSYKKGFKFIKMYQNQFSFGHCICIRQIKQLMF